MHIGMDYYVISLTQTKPRLSIAQENIHKNTPQFKVLICNNSSEWTHFHVYFDKDSEKSLSTFGILLAY